MGLVFDEVTSDMRMKQGYLFFLLYFYVVVFMSASYLPHLIIRVVLAMSFTFGMFAYRSKMGDVQDNGIAAIMLTFVIISQELSLYVNLKAKAKLYIKKKVNKN